MKRYLIFLPFLLLPLLPDFVLAQERLTPLARNPSIDKGAPSKQIRSQHDSSYLIVHPIDTLSLPLKDDFSRDRFKRYRTDTSLSNVKDSIFYRLFDTSGQTLDAQIGTWSMDTVGWMLEQDTSFRIQYDTSNGDTVPVAKTPLPSREILVNDLWTPEHDTVRYRVWPALSVRDSTWINKLDTVPKANPDHIQDSLPVVYFPTDSNNIWTDEQVFLNNTLSEDPPTVGFATFDGLDAEGLPYKFSDPYAYGEADALHSKPIDLETLTPLDSIFLSFFYQRKGLGNAPEPEDSLIVEFYEADKDEWVQVWSKEGGSGTSPRQVLIPVQKASYLKKGFRFRFKNFATLSGGFDHWHLDYVRLQKNRNPGDTLISDVAYTRKPNSWLETYSSVPWKHYQQDPGHLRDDHISYHRNLDGTGRFVEFYARAFLEGSQIWQRDQGVDANVQPNAPYTHSDQIRSGSPKLNLSPSLTDTSAVFNISLIQRTNPDTTASNDSITFEQSFQNYYAYDDGTAEIAYGVSASGTNTPRIGQRFDPYIGDTLIGAYIHFAPAFEDKSKESFFLTLWEDDGGVPGDQKYQNISFSNVEYGRTQTKFAFYRFDEPVVFGSDNAYFIGVDQTTQTRLNIGLDLNTDNSQRIYYSSGDTWKNTSYKGSLMIRPVYASDINVMSVSDAPAPEEELSVRVHPNPSQGRVQLTAADEASKLSVRVHDLSGRVVMEKKKGNKLDLSGESEGLYILRIRDERSGQHAVRKLMIQR